MCWQRQPRLWLTRSVCTAQYCSGGELFELLHKQPNKRFCEVHARFYTAEVLLALQYLHLLGFIYRDLKPENVLLHLTGHVRLTDFDLSFCASSRPHMLPPADGLAAARGPVLVRPGARGTLARRATLTHVERRSQSRSHSRTLSSARRSTSRQRRAPVFCVCLCPARLNPAPRRIAPQVINASGHSSPVDWWELGIFLYELMYGFTPFRGAHREQTFENVLHRALVFPDEPAVTPASQDCVRALLIRDPSRRLGAVSGAEEIKAHPFFADVDFTLIRWQTAPFVPSKRDNIPAVPPTEEFIFSMDG